MSTNPEHTGEAGTVPAWLVLFECGHTRHPDACHCGGDDDGHAPHDGPPPPGWAGWCVECGDFRTTVECIEADPLDGGHTIAMRQAAQVIARGHSGRKPEPPPLCPTCNDVHWGADDFEYACKDPFHQTGRTESGRGQS